MNSQLKDLLTKEVAIHKAKLPGGITHQFALALAREVYAFGDGPNVPMAPVELLARAAAQYLVTCCGYSRSLAEEKGFAALSEAYRRELDFLRPAPKRKQAYLWQPPLAPGVVTLVDSEQRELVVYDNNADAFTKAGFWCVHNGYVLCGLFPQRDAV